jgi:hypothetical protein
MGITSSDAGLAEPAGDPLGFKVGRPHDIPAIEGFDGINKEHTGLFPASDPVTPDMIRVREDQEGSHSSGNLYGIGNIEARRNDVSDPEGKEMPLSGGNFDSRDHKDC